MEMHPGKQVFIDDFFIESMVGTHRVLNCPEKITIDEPLHMVKPDRPWESEVAQGAIIYDEKNYTFSDVLSGRKLRNVRFRVPQRHSLGRS